MTQLIDAGLKSTPISLANIVRLFVGATIVSIVTFVLIRSFGVSLQLALLMSGGANDAWLLTAYDRQSRRLGWDTLRARFAAIERPLMLASLAGGLALHMAPGIAAAILRETGIAIADIPADTILPRGIDQLPLTVLVLVILGPLGEELLFRGLLLDWLERHIAAWQAIVISSLVFALLHDNHLATGMAGYIVFADRVLMGVGASMLALRCHSLRGSFLLHATNNLVTCILYALDV